jgi:catechol 2,3-dioxygenase-like lactoylglutathione lyase family enzyme
VGAQHDDVIRIGEVNPVRVFRIAIPASRIDRSRAFYEKVLGLEADDTVPSRLYFHCGDVIVALIDWQVEGRGTFQATPDDLYFATDELDATLDRAQAAQAIVVSAIETRPWGERSFYCLDPDGNRLCFVDETTLFLGRGADWS